MCLSQLIPILRVESPIVHLFPLALVVFVSMLKEGVEDYKRHVRDREHNTQKFRVFKDTTYTEISAENLKLGQLVMLKQGERVPADVLLLNTSEPNGASFVRTDQLDGETDWKLKRAVATTQSMSSVEQIYSLLSVATIEEPKDDFYNFSGKITFYYPEEPPEPAGAASGDPAGAEGDARPAGAERSEAGAGTNGAAKYRLVAESLNVDNVIWMNSIIASGTVHGLVIYVGKDARACLNSKRSRAKFGLFDKELNRLFIVLMLIMLGMCVLLLVPTGFEDKWYITFLKYLLLFSTIVPLSLRISLDIAKYVYNRAIVLDKKIPQAMPRTTVIPEELGRISYLLSDKTGTLTENVISLEKLYVSRGFYTNEDIELIRSKIEVYASANNIGSSTVQAAELGHGTSSAAGTSSSKPKGHSARRDAKQAEPARERPDGGLFSPTIGDTLEGRVFLALMSMAICHNVTPITNPELEPQFPAADKDREGAEPDGEKWSGNTSDEGKGKAKPESPKTELSEDADQAAGKNAGKDDSTEFQASSPDEIALVTFAHQCSVKLVKRDDFTMTLLLNGEISIEFRILFLLPFASETKRMGIIVEDRAGRKHFFLKGAEVVIIPLLLPRGSVWVSEECDNLARMGLRTLVFAYRAISDAEFAAFMAKYNEANLSLEDRVKKLRRVTGTLEHDMVLVGLTGVRDRLQRNVGRTLESIRNAGIKVWMLTGDKIDTAKCVAISAGLKQRQNAAYQISIESLMNPTYFSANDNVDLDRRVDKEVIDFINAFSGGDINANEAGGEQLSAARARWRRLFSRKRTFDHTKPAGAEDDAAYPGAGGFLGSPHAAGAQAPPGFNPAVLSRDIANRDADEQTKLVHYRSHLAYVVALIEAKLKHFVMGPTNSVLILDSFVIGVAMARLRPLFLKATTMAASVICCRCTPQMKADLVKMLRQNKHIVCSIGDGDNDVPMITEANVGVGIVGKEGLQASLSSDYSLVQFAHIKRLLLWHGRNSYKRSSNMSHFIMHRGVIISVMQAIFSSIYYFMPIAFFQGWLLVGFTSYYNMIPIFCLVLDEEICEEDVMLFPELYHELRRGRAMNIKTFLCWIWVSIFQGAILMIGAIILFENSLVSLIAIGCTSLFLLEIFNLISELHNWHRLTLIGILCTSLVYFYSLLVFRNNFDMEFIARKSFFWKVVVISLLGWLPIYAYKWLKQLLSPPQYVKLIVH